MAKEKVTVHLGRQLEKDIYNDCKLWVNTQRSTMIKLAKRRLTEAAKGIMLKYYEDYKPVWYWRIYNLRDASTIKPYIEHNKEKSLAGVYISNEGMKDYTSYYSYWRLKWYERKTPMPSVQVWRSAWIEGRHGVGKIVTHNKENHTVEERVITYRSGNWGAKTPYEELVISRDNMIANIQREGRNAARKQKYKTNIFE